MRTTPRNVVVEGPPRALDDLARDLRGAGFVVRAGWDSPASPWDLSGARIAHVGVVANRDDAAAALLIAARGACVLIAADADADLISSLFEDLGRLGPVDYHAQARPDPLAVLEPELRRLLHILAAGGSLEEAARQLSYSRRTVDRRLAMARSLLQVRTTAEAVMLARQPSAHLKQKLE